MGVQWLEPSRRDALAIGRVHEDVGCAATTVELDRQRTQVGGLQSEVGNDADTGELGEIPQKRSDRVRPGMDRARERDRLPRKLFPIYRSLGIDSGDTLCETPPRQHGKGRQGHPRRAQSLDEAAPAGRAWTARRIFTPQLFIWSHVAAPAGGSALAFTTRGRALPVTFLPLACNLRGRACRFPSPPRGPLLYFHYTRMLCVGIRKQSLTRASKTWAHVSHSEPVLSVVGASLSNSGR